MRHLLPGCGSWSFAQMSLLPRVSEKDRELVCQEFDTRGPAVCMVEVIEHLQRENPEFIDMAARCAADSRNPAKLMVGVGMFYRLLVMSQPASGTGGLMPLPRVSPQARDQLVAEIDTMGSGDFTRRALADLEVKNPELFQMAHSFASAQAEYLHAMQGFALLYRSLVIQATIERRRLH
jgi:hypothetical protein